ncbi:helix-turn-helix domain-containing protein [Arenicella xantha]|uniref:Helix-turn-helix protein n=1 Tax=Arenicella xantha TaxID=644221 RepID=A0A395JN81_9GAMM|nr:helix-turn-helix domain-containing protein [Arenicella xantha]RBP49354.1 helix-turn-helix protein [Arenicella xantha]
MARSLQSVLENEKAEVVNRAESMATQMLLEIHLAELRQLLEKTQSEIAEAMGVTQPTIAGIEKLGNDMKLSSLKKYIEALGGKLNINIEAPDGKNYGFPV